MDSTGREDDLVLGADRLYIAAGNGPELDGRNLPGLVHHKAGNLVLDQEVEVGSAGSNVGVVANTSVRALNGLRVLSGRNPAKTMLVTIGAIFGGLKTKLLPSLPRDT